MSLWADGYVSDVEYLPGYYVEQSPGHLQLACLLNGFEPPLTGPEFTYCELGCGQGVTANLIAAANPRARVVAMDFNPAHIARARSAAKQAGLTNVEFLELSFADLAGQPHLKDFDIVSLHGVWSWIGDKDRAAITQFLSRGVRPGGLVAVSYNAMPGWTALLPFQRMLLEYSRLGHDRSDARVLQALEFVEKLQKAGCRSVGDPALLERLRAGNGKSPASDQAIYLAHEYLNENWLPLYHVDTARILSDAKLNFVASATLLENFPDLTLTPEQREILATLPGGAMRETLKDYFVNRPFRRDIFIRGAQRLPDARRDALIGAFGLAMTIPLSATKLELDVPAGKATLPKAHYQPIFEALADGPRSVRELADLPELRGVEGRPTLVEIGGVLAGTLQALPLPFGLDVDGSPQALSYNRLAVRPVVERQAATAAVASPLSGSGLTLSTIEAVTYDALAHGASPEDAVGQIVDGFLAEGGPLQKDGKVLTEPEVIRETVAADARWCIEQRLPVWRRLLMI